MKDNPSVERVRNISLLKSVGNSSLESVGMYLLRMGEGYQARRRPRRGDDLG